MFGDAERALQRIALGGVHRSSLHLARDIKSVCLALQLAARLADALFVGGNGKGAAIATATANASASATHCERWAALRGIDPSATFSWLQTIVDRVDVDDALGIASGSDRLLDQLRDAKGPREEIAEFEKLAAEFNVPAVKISRGRSPEDLHFSVMEKYGEVISAAARDNFRLRYVGQRAHSTRWTTEALEKMGLNTHIVFFLSFVSSSFA